MSKPPNVPCPPRNPHCNDIIDSVSIDNPVWAIAVVVLIIIYLIFKTYRK